MDLLLFEGEKMRAPITDKHLLEMMWERFPEIMKRGTEQPAQQEPVANYCRECLTYNGHHEGCSHYASPPAQRTWVGLTIREIEELTLLVGRMDYTRMLQLAEAKLQEKNT